MKNAKSPIHFVILAVLIALSTVASYYLVLQSLFVLPIQASEEAKIVDTLFQRHFWLIAFLFSIIAVPVVYSIVVFRRKPGDEEDGEFIHGSTSLELLWTFVPLVFVLMFGYWGWMMLDDITEEKDNELVVEVRSWQWGWSFSYPEYDLNNQGVLALPVDRTALLKMYSDDVIHSFWVPEFRIKQDLMPGMETTMRITPVELGSYKVRCAEICGTGHAAMLKDVEVMTQEDFDAWVDTQSLDPVPVLAELEPAERGEIWANNGTTPIDVNGSTVDVAGFTCVSCHSIDGSAMAGPTWQNLYNAERAFVDGTTSTADDEYIRTSILEPYSQIVEGYGEVMPANFSEQFGEFYTNYGIAEGEPFDVIEDLTAYIESVSEVE